MNGIPNWKYREMVEIARTTVSEAKEKLGIIKNNKIREIKQKIICDIDKSKIDIDIKDIRKSAYGNRVEYKVYYNGMPIEDALVDILEKETVGIEESYQRKLAEIDRQFKEWRNNLLFREAEPFKLDIDLSL